MLDHVRGFPYVYRPSGIPQPATPSGQNAYNVLTDRNLWTLITDLMPGWPFIVFDKLVAKPYRNLGEYPKSEGLLLHVAIFGDDHEMFDRLWRLRKFPFYRDHPKLQIGELMCCAVCAQHIGPLQWTFQTLSLDPS